MKNILLILPFLFWCGCEDSQNNEEDVTPSGPTEVELSIERVGFEFMITWTMNGDIDFLKYILKSGTDSGNITDVLVETSDRLTSAHRIPFTGDEMYFQVDVANLENEITSSNIVSINTDYPLSTDFLYCGLASMIRYSLPDSTILNEDYRYWDGLIYYYVHDMDTTIVECNEYGMPTRIDFSKREDYRLLELTFEYMDYWKGVERVEIDTNGVSDTINYTWDGLTRVSDDSNYIRTYNEYGRLISRLSADQNLIIFYLKDGRRPYKEIDNGTEYIYLWNDLTYEKWEIGQNDTLLSRTGIIDEYGHNIEYTDYNCTEGESFIRENICRFFTK